MARNIIFDSICSAVLFLGIFLFLWLGCPQYLMYQEQYQLFLFSGSYFSQAVSIPGGIADYISEFVVQFYYVPLYGAMLAALVLTLSQVFLGLSFRRFPTRDVAYVVSSLPSLLYLAAMSDENILLSYAVSMMLTSLFLYLITLFNYDSHIVGTLILIFGFAVLYWMAGPLAFVLIFAWGIITRKAVVMPALIGWFIVWAIHGLWFEQYPLSSFVLGINYYRIPEIHPAILFVIAAVMTAVPLVTLIKGRVKGMISYAVEAAIAILAFFYVPAAFNADKSRVFALDSLVRQGRWSEIIELANKEKPTDPFSLQALNLALGMTGQLPESMFRFDQRGTEGLIGGYKLDNTSQLVTAEALFRLGLTNIAFSTTFDLQEAIMNDRKSGRFMKRMAECMIINGNYDVAAKYIGMLGKSLFYKDWAKKMENLLGDDAAVESHPIYGPLRRNGFTKTAFYDPSQLDKILAILVLDSNGSNKLALDYFYATTMLKGDLATLVGVCNFYQDRFAERSLPRHVQEAIAMYWTAGHQSFEGIPFPISMDVQQQTIALANAVMTKKNNPAAWKNAAPDSFGVYFLNMTNRKQPETTVTDYQPTHE